MKHRIVIARHRPWLRPTLVGLGAATLALSGWGLYSYTRTHTVSDFARAQTEVQQLREERRDLTRQLRDAESQIAKLKDQVVYVQRSSEINGQACETVRTTLPQLQGEVADLREKLAFYRGIVAPDQSRAGVRVYNLKMTPGGAANNFHYELVLIQSMRHDRRVGGRIDMQIEGLRNGSRETLTLADVGGGAGKNLLFSFTYFQEFGGQLQLPAGFKPVRVTVKLTTDVEGAPDVEDQFDWDRIVTT